MANGRKWTTSEVRRMAAMAKAGKTAADIGLAINRSRDAVFVKASSLNIRLKRKDGLNRWTDAEMNLLRRLVRQSMPWDRISEYFRNRSECACVEKARQMGLKYYEPRFARKKTTRRLCICCTEPFNSDGPHHRMCTPCRSGQRAAPAGWEYMTA